MDIEVTLLNGKIIKAKVKMAAFEWVENNKGRVLPISEINKIEVRGTQEEREECLHLVEEHIKSTLKRQPRNERWRN